MSTRQGPSRLWYVVAVAIILVGIGAAFIFMLSRLEIIADSLIRFVVPGETTITLNEPGRYTIFHETSGTLDGVVYSAADITGLRVTLKAADTGAEITLEQPGASTSYNFRGSSAVGVLAFTIDAPGEYQIGAAYDDGRTEPRAILSVTQGFIGKLLGAIFGVMAVALGSAAAGITLGVVTFLRRRRARTQADPPAAPS